MTEEQWRAEGDPWRLCELARATTSVKTRWHGSRSWPTFPAAAKRVRLAEVACFRRVAAKVPFLPMRNLFRVIERHAEGALGDGELDAAVGEAAMLAAQRGGRGRTGFSAAANAATTAMGPLIAHRAPAGERFFQLVALAEVPDGIDEGTPEFDAAVAASLARSAETVREVLGPFHRMPAVNRDWLRVNDGAAVRVLDEIRLKADFALMPVLADALEDAGCDDAELVAHCRRDGGHLRECWVLAALAGAVK